MMEIGRGTDKGGKRRERKEGRSYHDTDGIGMDMNSMPSCCIEDWENAST